MSVEAFNRVREKGYTNLSDEERREYHRLYQQLRKQGFRVRGRYVVKRRYSKIRRCCGQPMVKGKLPRFGAARRLEPWKHVLVCRVCGNVV